MSDKYVGKISQELGLKATQVSAVMALFLDGGTVPFIARYRKEATGGLDEVAIVNIRDRGAQLVELDKRRDAILKSIDEQGKLSDELKKKINAAETMSVLEDIYLPYRPKRRTRATIAKEKGLEPLAKVIFEQGDVDPTGEAGKYIDKEKEVETTDDALAGARDIIAEWINESSDARARLRKLFDEKAEMHSKVLSSKKDEEDAAKFRDYFEWDEPICDAPSHRILAVRRGEKEGFLSMRILPEEANAVRILEDMFMTASNSAADQVKLAITDSYKRLLSLSLETEIRLNSKKRADQQAIDVFSENLRELLLDSPLGQKNVLALDPGFRTGCKVVCLDRQGKLLFNDTIYPHPPQNQAEQAAAKIMVLCEKFQIEAIAIGNGTAGRETMAFCRGLKIPNVTVVMVNEAGASVYSASEAAREEFPDYDVTVRGSVSIGRRLMDPLAELVKIDAKSIGVGQYQHDVDQRLLKQSLDDVVVSCVNAVGVEVNTASKQLLSYVSGLGPQLAGNIVKYRDENGAFTSRKQLKKVPRLGDKAFQQAAGFLRVRDGENPLDASAVHPESYHIVDTIAADMGCGVSDLLTEQSLSEKVDLNKYVTETVGLPTLNDIIAELAKPGRDPRKEFESFSFTDGVNEMSDLTVGMKLPGVVTNVTAFGAFVDVGVHQDGLVHISQLADRFVNNPADVVKVNQKVNVTVMEVDIARKRIGLSMRANPFEQPTPNRGSNNNSRPNKNTNRPPKRQQPRESISNNAFGDLLKNWKK